MIPNQRPWSVQIEMTEGCNRRCSFCGIHSLYREHEDVMYKFMTPETARALARDLNKWLPKARIEFALQGEPLLNRNAHLILQAFREEFNNAQLMLTTNMDPLKSKIGFDSEKVFRLFKCGLNILVCDYYGEEFDPNYADFFTKIKEASWGIPIYDFYKDKNNSDIWSFQGDEIYKIVVIDNTENRNINRTLNNQAGNTNPELITFDKLRLPKMTRCQQPFREMSIKYDGAIPICCMDWSREHIMGKFPEDGTTEQIWQNFHFAMVRELLFYKRRDLLKPCDRCNYHGYKLGFIKSPQLGVNHATLSEQVKKEQDKNKKYENRYARVPFEYS